MNGLQIVIDVLLIAALIYLWRAQRKANKPTSTPSGGLPEPTTAERIRAAVDAHEAEFHRR